MTQVMKEIGGIEFPETIASIAGVDIPKTESPKSEEPKPTNPPEKNAKPQGK